MSKSTKHNISCEYCDVTHHLKDDQNDFNNVFYLYKGIYFRVKTFCEKCLEEVLQISNNKCKAVTVHKDTDKYIDSLCNSLKKSVKKSMNDDKDDPPF